MARKRGSVYQRGSDGRWVAEIKVKGKRYYDYAKSEAEAEAILERLKRWVLHGQPPSPAAASSGSDMPTVAGFIDYWLSASTLSPATEEFYRRILKTYVLPLIGEMPLDAVKPMDIARVIAQAKTRGRSIAAKSYAAIRRLFQVAVDWGLITENPAAKLSRPRSEPMPRVVWTREQTAAFSDTLLHRPCGPWDDLFLFALYTGLRTSELLGLNWTDVNLEQKTITIQRGLLELTGRQWILSDVKTRASRRTIGLPEPAIIALSRRQKKTGPVFRRADGSPPSRSALRSALIASCRRIGVPYIGMHGLRHQHCTMLAWAGVPIRVAQERMGHSTPEITLAIYMHALPEDHLLAAVSLNGLFQDG